MMSYLSAILTACLFIIILTDNSSALRINELESNPEGEDSGFEWVELYSEDNVNLEGYVLDHDGRGALINLSGSFQGFFVITLQTQWLRNSNETVYLKLNNGVVDRVGPFSDNKEDKTYGLCDDGWKFMSPSKNGENDCGQTNNNETSNEKRRENNTEEKKSKINNTVALKDETASESVPKQNKKIVLGEQPNTVGEITKTYNVRVSVIYFFMGFCVLLVILIALRKL